jgi:2-beta-glucuronyltransferase
MAAAVKPDMNFHIFGSHDNKLGLPNVKFHGMIHFKELAPYIKHADLGLQTISVSKNMAVLEKTLKIVQYTYCSLPILAPALLNLDMSNVFKYERFEESVKSAIDLALSFDRSTVERAWILDWTELANRLLQETDLLSTQNSIP